MKIIGIKILKGARVVIKNLQPGWYPFGRYEEPRFEMPYLIPNWEDKIKHVYQRYPSLPEISVSCIVGKNGAGKSTLIEILLRLINNFAFYLLDGKADDTDDFFTGSVRHMSYARGLFASLYFEADGNLGVIKCDDLELSYQVRIKSSGKIICHNNKSLSKIKNKGRLLRSFFYTIECNYSQYGFRPNDYESANDNDFLDPLDAGVTGEWVEGLFHKNDGYHFPVVLTPFRKNGFIDYALEDRLANRRLITLAILYYTQRQQFLPGYNPSYLTYSFDQDVIVNLQDSLTRNTKIFDRQQIGYLMSNFEDAWNRILDKELGDSLNDETWSALMYLGYKSLKICLKYSSYQRRFALKTFCKALAKGGNAFSEFTHTKAFYNRINSIVLALYKENSYITLKIHQCIEFLKRGRFTNKTQRVYVSDYVKKIKRFTYDGVYKCLPPPYFKVDLTMIPAPLQNKTQKKSYRSHFTGGMVKRDEKGFCFSQMSSGERQLMNSMSYVLYHIKNIQSIKADSDRVAYHHMNFIFDEAELYFHPEYQRYLLKRIIEMLHWCHIDRRKIRSINIILATHSPYVLSDVFTEKTLYLKTGQSVKVNQQSFGANYYNMLHNSFFFEDSPMGAIATETIQEWIDKKDYKRVPLIGDPVIKRYLNRFNMKDDVSNYQE